MNIYSFEKLDSWIKAKELSLIIYNLTRKFPVEERFGLVSQLRRAAISVSSNLAEGVSRSSFKDQARFSEISYGSLIEVLNQSIISFEIGLINEKEYKLIRIRIDELSNKINSLRNSQLSRIRI